MGEAAITPYTARHYIWPWIEHDVCPPTVTYMYGTRHIRARVGAMRPISGMSTFFDTKAIDNGGARGQGAVSSESSHSGEVLLGTEALPV